MMLQRRPISPLEVGVLRAAIERAPFPPVPEGILDALDALRVVSRCDCGCDSVDFETPESDQPPRRVADGIASTPSGGQVGILIWARDGHISSLEVYDLGAGEHDLRLPALESIRPWEAASAG